MDDFWPHEAILMDIIAARLRMVGRTTAELFESTNKQ
jgi:hypothetical protein